MDATASIVPDPRHERRRRRFNGLGVRTNPLARRTLRVGVAPGPRLRFGWACAGTR